MDGKEGDDGAKRKDDGSRQFRWTEKTEMDQDATIRAVHVALVSVVHVTAAANPTCTIQLKKIWHRVQ